MKKIGPNQSKIIYYKRPTGQLRQLTNTCNMAFFRQKALTTEQTLEAFLAQGTLFLKTSVRPIKSTY